MKKGIFWCTDWESEHPHLITVTVKCDPNGVALEPVEYSSKSGENFNHKAEWDKLDRSVTQGLPYNYYPRGRVEIRNAKATVFYSPDLNYDTILDEILATFEIAGMKGLTHLTVTTDGSEHYRHLA